MSMNSLSAPPPIQPLPPPYRERKPVPVLSPNDLSRNNGGFCKTIVMQGQMEEQTGILQLALVYCILHR